MTSLKTFLLILTSSVVFSSQVFAQGAAPSKDAPTSSEARQNDLNNRSQKPKKSTDYKNKLNETPSHKATRGHGAGSNPASEDHSE
jgi:hypothetical protein